VLALQAFLGRQRMATAEKDPLVLAASDPE
jgi:hypothetical protein